MGSNSISVWDRSNPSEEFALRRTLDLLGATAAVTRSAIGKGRYSVLPSFQRLRESSGELPVLNCRDEDELRTVLVALLEDCTANGIDDVDLLTVSDSTAATALKIARR